MHAAFIFINFSFLTIALLVIPKCCNLADFFTQTAGFVGGFFMDEGKGESLFICIVGAPVITFSFAKSFQPTSEGPLRPLERFWLFSCSTRILYVLVPVTSLILLGCAAFH